MTKDQRLNEVNAASRARHDAGKPQPSFDAGWNESDHSRNHGQFASGSGGGEEKTYSRAEVVANRNKVAAAANAKRNPPDAPGVGPSDPKPRALNAIGNRGELGSHHVEKARKQGQAHGYAGSPNQNPHTSPRNGVGAETTKGKSLRNSLFKHYNEAYEQGRKDREAKLARK